MNAYLEALVTTAEALVAEAPLLNSLDSVAGDGDLGATITLAAQEVMARAGSLDGATLPDTLRGIGTGIGRAAPSTAGSLIAAGLIRASQVLHDRWSADAEGVATLLTAVAAGVAERGGARPGAKTMLDALEPAALAAEGRADGATSPNVKDALTRAAAAAEAGAQATRSMEPRHGRAGWLAERSLGHEDAGARLIALILRRYAEALPSG